MIARLKGLAVLLVLLAAGLCGPATAQDQAGKRLALVIGNAAYAAGPLPTAANDAGLVAQTLAQAGFDVTGVGDGHAETIRLAFKDFLGKVRAAGPQAAVFVYLAGYGLQFDGDNFLVPVDADIVRDVDVPTAAVRLSDFTHLLETTPARARIFAYDLAREHPFARTGMPLAGGLAAIEPPDGSLYAFNAAPGTVAPANSAPYGVFARALAEAIQAPGLSMESLFARVRLRVGELTNGAAVPWSDGKVDPGLTFFPAEVATAPAEQPADAASIATLSPPAAFSAAVQRDTLAAYEAFVAAFPGDRQTPRVRMMIAARRESLIWSESQRVNSSRAYWTYMRRYPRGPHFGDCRRRLATIQAALEPPPRFDIYSYEGLPPPSPDEVAMVQRPALMFRDADWAPIPPPPPSVLPPRRPAFYDDLPPPPLPPKGALPLPVPVPLAWDPARTKSAFHPPGVVAQPFVPGYGRMTSESRSAPAGAATVTVTSDKDVVVSKTTAVVDHGTRTIVQKGGDDAVISRTVTTHAGDTLTTVQSGPSGTVLSKAVTQGQPGGERSTIITNGADQVITSVRTNGSGIVTSRTSGAAAPVHEMTSAEKPSAALAAPPTVKTPAGAPPLSDPIRRGEATSVKSAPTSPASPQPVVGPSSPLRTADPAPMRPDASAVPKIVPPVPVPVAPSPAIPQGPATPLAPAVRVEDVKPPLPSSEIDPGKAPSIPIADPSPVVPPKPRAPAPETTKTEPATPGPVPRPEEIKGKSVQHRPSAPGRPEPRGPGRADMPREHRKARAR